MGNSTVIAFKMMRPSGSRQDNAPCVVDKAGGGSGRDYT